jgi:serine/threonine protein kinase
MCIYVYVYVSATVSVSKCILPHTLFCAIHRAYPGTHCTYPGNYNGSEVAVKEITLQNRRVRMRVCADVGMRVVYTIIYPYDIHDYHISFHFHAFTLTYTQLDDVEFLAELQLEAQALKAFRHRNVVRYFGLLQGWVLGKRYLKGIVTEFCERGALSDLIFSDQFANLSLQTKLRIACDVIQGLAFLHAQGFLHRDIQCENVLLDSAGTAKLTGLSKLLGDQLEGKSATGEVRVVIPDGKEPLLQMHNISEVEKFSGDSKRRNTQKGWQAPELLSGKKVTYTSKMDIYAYGCLLYWYACVCICV